MNMKLQRFNFELFNNDLAGILEKFHMNGAFRHSRYIFALSVL